MGTMLFFSIGLVGTYFVSWLSFGVGLIVACAVSLWGQKKAQEAQRPSCVTTGSPATFVGWQGTLQIFEIPSAVYATALLRENSHKAVNLNSEALEALAGTDADLTRQSVR